MAFLEEPFIAFPAPPPFRCPSCGLPFWIVRECNGGWDHVAGRKLAHTPVDAVPAHLVSKRP